MGSTDLSDLKVFFNRMPLIDKVNGEKQENKLFEFEYDNLCEFVKQVNEMLDIPGDFYKIPECWEQHNFAPTFLGYLYKEISLLNSEGANVTPVIVDDLPRRIKWLSEHENWNNCKNGECKFGKQ